MLYLESLIFPWNVLITVLSPLCRTKALVLELLAAVCLVRGGHEIILAAFDHFKEVKKDILPSFIHFIYFNLMHIKKKMLFIFL